MVIASGEGNKPGSGDVFHSKVEVTQLFFAVGCSDSLVVKVISPSLLTSEEFLFRKLAFVGNNFNIAC
jgi:hypothetical protein